MNIISLIRGWWRQVRRRRRIDRIVQIDSMSELPRRLGNSLFVVGSPPKWAVLRCPCGCGERIDVNLMKSKAPRWTLELEQDGASLNPSLWMPADKCESHFWIRRNRICWADDSCPTNVQL